jgi:hypothetical protein
MQPPPPPPIPDIPPPVTLTLPGGQVIPLTGLPQTPEQLQGLRERREILRDQLERAVNRRENLINELNGQDGQQLAPEARAGVQQRLNLIDERILQIERDQAFTERLLSSADPEVLAMASAQQRDMNSMVDEDAATGIAFTTFGAGILLAMLVGRFRRRRSTAKPNAGQATVSFADDPRIEQLTQTVEAIAEEVERIGEGQRFVTQLLANRPEAAVLRGEPQGR